MVDIAAMLPSTYNRYNFNSSLGQFFDNRTKVFRTIFLTAVSFKCLISKSMEPTETGHAAMSQEMVHEDGGAAQVMLIASLFPCFLHRSYSSHSK